MSLTYEYDSSPLVSGDELDFTDIETKVITITNSDSRRKTVEISLLGAGFNILSSTSVSSTSVSIEASGTSDVSIKSVTDTPGNFSTKLTINDDFFILSLDVTGYEDLYTSRTLLEDMYGKYNILKWADQDGTEDQNEIEARIYRAILRTMAEMDGKLSNGAYAVPFTNPIPAIIEDIATTLAGCRLYAARAMFSPDFDKMTWNNKKEALRTLGQVERGLIHLGVDKRCNNYPVVLENN